MGCWNGTDGITGASISAGEDTYALIGFIERGFFKPVFFPILGKYNDYGQIEDIDVRRGDLSPYEMLKYLNKLKEDKSIVEIDDSRDECSDPKTIYDWINCAERESLNYIGFNGSIESVELVLFSKDIFEKAVEVGKKTKTWQGDVREDTLQAKIDEIMKMIKDHKKSDEKDFLFDYEIRDKVESLCGGRYEWQNNFTSILSRDDVSIKKKKGLLEEILSFSCFLFFMDDMRLSIGRTVGAGSQDSNEEIQADFYKFAWKRAAEKVWESDVENCPDGMLKVGELE